ncbi:MAG: transketolase [Deltaproteobacteria bacterium]|nr:transketolase [Deltaproteobacteria bacterium]
MVEPADLASLARLVRYYILTSTTEAGSGHPTTSLSATDLMTTLFFKYLRFDLARPAMPNNDRLIFSKGHAAPLYYALFAAAGKLSQEQINGLRLYESPLEGHPTPRFTYAEVATGSLGQGLSIGVGMALNARYLDKLTYRTYVLLGDGELAEGSVWEAVQLAAYYKLDNLIAVVDINRIGQSRETMWGHDVESFAKKFSAFGWEVAIVDGHSIAEIESAYDRFLSNTESRPKVIIAKTLKGKGVSFLEDKLGWHGKALSRQELEKALQEIGPVDLKRVGQVQKPEDRRPEKRPVKNESGPAYKPGNSIATRKAYGEVLASLVDRYPEIVAVDGDTSNSTFSEIVAQRHPENYFEMFIAEQNMIGVALGLSKRGKVPFASTFAAFLTRAFDQIRMAAVSRANLKCVGSHVGVSIGEDGPSQMGLEDIAMFRSISGSTVLYPSDAVATGHLVEEAVKREGIVYIRTSRPATPVIYPSDEKFPIGGSKTIKSSSQDKVTVVAAGVTLFEALKAYDQLQKEGISIRVIDCYSVKPLDEKTLRKAAQETKSILVVEDHWFEGGIGDAVLNVFAEKPSVPIIKLAVCEMPRSGKPAELLEAAGISASCIVKKIKEIA